MQKSSAFTATIVLVSIAACLFQPLCLRAQVVGKPSCEILAQTVSLPFKHPESRTAEMLEVIRAAAQQARLCYQDTHLHQRIWLLNQEVRALDGLKRYGEAEHLVHHFYNVFADKATAEHKARFALHRLRYSSWRGAFSAAEDAYRQAMLHVDALPPEDQHLAHLEGAHLYYQAGRHREAAGIARAVYEKVPAEEISLARARARFIGANAELRLQQEKVAPDPSTMQALVSHLEEAATQFQALQAFDRYGAALAVLGRAHLMMGNTNMYQSYLDLAEQIFRQHDDAKGRIFALLHRGQVFTGQGDADKAEQALTRALALADSSGTGTYSADIYLELGKLYRSQGRWTQAENYFRQITDPPSDTFSEGALRYVAARQQAQRHLLGVLEEQRRQARLQWMAALAGLLLLLGIVTGLLVRTRRQLHREDPIRALRLDGVSSPQFQVKRAPSLPERRMGYMRLIFKAPAEAAALIRDDDPHLARRVEKGRLRSRRELYLSVAIIEQALEGRHLNNPSDTIRMDLSRYFKRSPWPWPDSIEAWQRHLEAHTPAIPRLSSPAPDRSVNDAS